MALFATRRGCKIVFALASLLFLSQVAVAQTTADRVRSKALFDEGRALVDTGNYDEACPRFEKSLAIDPGIGTRFNLADCWEHTNRAAGAQLLFTRVADDAHALGQFEREQVARERASALESQSNGSSPEAAPVVLEPVVVPGADQAELRRQLQSEYGVLAEVEVGIRELKRSLALLAPPTADPRVRKLHGEMASLDDALSKAWRAASRVTAELAAQKTTKAGAAASTDEARVSQGARPRSSADVTASGPGPTR